MKLKNHICIILVIVLFFTLTALFTGCTTFEVITAAETVVKDILPSVGGGNKKITKIQTGGDDIIIIWPVALRSEIGEVMESVKDVREIEE